jgi:hypothetical protein
MAKYELFKKIDIDGDTSFHIRKDGEYIYGSFTRLEEEAQDMLERFTSGTPTEPIIELIKTIETNER